MSFSAFLYKFKDRNIDTVPWNEVEKFAKQYGHLGLGVGGYEITFDDEIIADVVDVQGDPENGLSGFSLNRPIECDETYDFIYTALKDFGMIFFDQEYEQAYALKDIGSDIPENLLENFGGVITVIKNKNEIWNNS